MSLHNDFTSLPLKNFTGTDIDILMSLCYKVKNTGTTEVEMSFSELREYADYKSTSLDRFYDDIKKMSEKLFSLDFQFEDEHKYIKFYLFKTFMIDKDNKFIRFNVNEEFAYMLNDLIKDYTSIDVKRLVSINSSYIKIMYMQLRKWRKTGKWIVSAEDFKELLSIPSSYKQCEIDRTIIKPSIETLKEHFPKLKCEKEYKSIGRGRPTVSMYKFTFVKQVSDKPVKKSDGGGIKINYDDDIMNEIKEKAKKYNMSVEDFMKGVMSETIDNY